MKKEIEKIFQEDVYQLLKSLNVSDKEIARMRHDKLNEHVLAILEQVVEHVENMNYTKVKKHAIYSPAGDEAGSDNYFINFGGCSTEEYMDISEVCDQLEMLKEEMK